MGIQVEDCLSAFIDDFDNGSDDGKLVLIGNLLAISLNQEEGSALEESNAAQSKDVLTSSDLVDTAVSIINLLIDEGKMVDVRNTNGEDFEESLKASVLNILVPEELTLRAFAGWITSIIEDLTATYEIESVTQY